MVELDGKKAPTGRCYIQALLYTWMNGGGMATDFDGVIVHGKVTADGKTINHAWVKLNSGLIYNPDPINPPESARLIKEEVFNNVLSPTVDAEYTSEEATVLHAKTQHAGPWEAWEKKDLARETKRRHKKTKQQLKKLHRKQRKAHTVKISPELSPMH
jgi:murein L,D-transpeptidase YafK